MTRVPASSEGFTHRIEDHFRRNNCVGPDGNESLVMGKCACGDATTIRCGVCQAILIYQSAVPCQCIQP